MTNKNWWEYKYSCIRVNESFTAQRSRFLVVGSYSKLKLISASMSTISMVRTAVIPILDIGKHRIGVSWG
jgi:hypothetical protein